MQLSLNKWKVHFPLFFFFLDVESMRYLLFLYPFSLRNINVWLRGWLLENALETRSGTDYNRCVDFDILQRVCAPVSYSVLINHLSAVSPV